jgi:hypothetical protein
VHTGSDCVFRRVTVPVSELLRRGRIRQSDPETSSAPPALPSLFTDNSARCGALESVRSGAVLASPAPQRTMRRLQREWHPGVLCCWRSQLSCRGGGGRHCVTCNARLLKTAPLNTLVCRMRCRHPPCRNNNNACSTAALQPFRKGRRARDGNADAPAAEL